mgnify:CR=1 FL=1
MKNKKDVVTFCWDIGILILTFIISNICITTFLQFANVKMSSLNVIISIITSILIFLFLRRDILKEKIVKIILEIIFVSIIVIVCTLIAGLFLDMTCDGNYYHKTAIGAIKEGWNPVYESSYDFNLENNLDMADQKSSLWMDHYPKMTWNFAASMYALTNNIESGKCLIFLLMISLCCLAFSYLYERHLNFIFSGVIAVLLVFNPITCAQLSSYYVDGIMGLLIYMTILFLICITDKKFTEISECEKWLGLSASIILCMNVKFTGIFFEAIFCIAFYLVWIFRYIKGKNIKEKEVKNNILRLTLIFASIVVVGIVVVGESTYVKNMIEHKSPLYPLICEDKVDIITTMQPKSFGEKNRFIKLFESVFSRSENVTYYSGDEPQLKVPFSVSDSEKNNISIPDLRIGGFGVYYSGIVIISIFVICVGMYILYKKQGNVFLYCMTILVAIVLTTLILDEAWWARYSPQLWLLPVIALFVIFYNNNNVSIKQLRFINLFIGALLTILIIVNNLMFIKWRVNDLRISINIIEEVKRISNENTSVELGLIDKSRFGILYNLNDNKLNYKLVEYKEDMKNFFYNNWIGY